MTEQKEEIVISGIGGVFPECENVDELKELLFNKLNGVTLDSRRWKPNTLGAISGTGKLKYIDKFDSTFFSIHPKLADSMDTITRIFLEKSIEAIIDAGLSPTDLSGTNTSVFACSSLSETEISFYDLCETNKFKLLGLGRTMQANRISYFLNLTGPSYSSDGGWICGSNSLEKAKKLIEEGVISAAIVGVSNLVLKPEIQFQFQGVNRLNQNIYTKSFDSHADGYNRSEACVVMFLQKASDAKRSYGTLLNVQSMQFGDHQGHILEHVGTHFKSMLVKSYKEANIDPATVEFIEANGSGIKNEDSMELNIMEEVFCTKQRKTPLKVGSVKSNVGNCEASGLFVSIVKAIIAFESGYLPPNINYTEPNENVQALKIGKIQVITEKTLFNGDIIGINSFGTLNTFSHVIIKRNNKIKKDYKETSSKNYIPRLILASGRNEENARKTLEKIIGYGNDDEYLTLINNVFTKKMNAHFYRGFSIFSDIKESRIADIWNISPKKRPVWFIFSGMGSQWHGMGSNLMTLPIFADVINKCDCVLKPQGVDIKNILTSVDPTIFDNILNSFVGIAAVQIGLVEVLRALDITPDGMIGHSLGEAACGYADGCFTLEEMILSAYARGRASIETDLVPGMMAAIGLGYHQIKDQLPADVDVACHNSATSCTISGPVDSINAFVTELKSKGVFAKAVNVAGIAYHSRYIQSVGPTLLKYLKEVIKQPKIRSSKWISSSLPETEWNSDLAKYSSAEYHTNNLLSSVLFEDALKHIPSDAITIEIAPHGLLQAIIRGALPDSVTNIPLTKKVFGGDSVHFLLTAIGKMYTSGLNPKIQELYSKVTLPVGRGTPPIHSLPLWDHSTNWKTINSASHMKGNSGEIMSNISLNNNNHLIQYQIQGHHILPFSFVLVHVWKTFIEININIFNEEPVEFNNLRFKNNAKIHPTRANKCYLMIQWGSGSFEYSFNNEVILTGQLQFIQNDDVKLHKPDQKTLDDYYGCVSKDEIYAIFENNGFHLGDDFKTITNIHMYKNNIQGYVKWKNDWIYFLDGLLKFPLLENVDMRFNEAVTSIRQITVDPKTFKNNIEGDDVHIDYNITTNEITCAGLKISNVETYPIRLPQNNSTIMTIEDQTFVSFCHIKCKTINDFIFASFDIIMEADKLKLETNTSKLVLCMPYHYDDPISNECKKAIAQIIENQLWIYNASVNWENVNNIRDNDETERFITVTNINYLKDLMKTLSNKKEIYIFVCSKKELGDFKDWKIIIQRKYNDDNYLALIKKKNTIEENCVFIKSVDDIHNQIVWKTLQTINSSNQLIYVVSYTEPLEGINIYVNNMLRKYSSQKMRFLFILDSNAPDFELSKSFYQDQLSIGLIINIYKNGTWGYYKRIPLQDVTDNSLDLKNPVPNIFSTDRKLTIKYLGLNFKDLFVEDDTESEFGPLEYSGFIENNQKIMGITPYDQTSTQIKYDPLLSWPVPSTWSLKDAATVPLSYSICYFAFKVIVPEEIFLKSVLVTSGLHPIGQAVISISLSENVDVYAIVDSSHQADELSIIYPKLPRSRILINTKNQFDIQIKMMTKAKGIDIIFNFLSGEAFHSAIRVLTDKGIFFNFSKSDMKNQRLLGTRTFLNGASFYVISSNLFLNESDHNKEIIQRAFMDGLNRNVIKPFQCFTSKISFHANKMFEIMRTTFKSNISEKVVMSFDDYKKCCSSQEIDERWTYQCYPDHLYLIIDHKSDWLDLAEWLVNRGARKIVIFVNTCLMSITNSKRFNRLISRKISIQIQSDSLLKSKDETLNWFNHLTSSNVLGSIFVLNQLNDDKMNNLRYAFENYINRTMTTSFICISSKGEHICNTLKSIGVKALNISWDGNSLEPNGTGKILSLLDSFLQKPNTLGSSSIVCSEKNNYKLQKYQQMNDVIKNVFPDSFDELCLLNDNFTKEPCFVEVQTRSPRFSQTKSVTPLFVIPGFKPKLMNSFYEKLIYPTFVSYLPENISSIDELSEMLVKKLKNISNQDYVSLIGESWGGIVALKMAQILESQGTMVTVSLIEGDPEILISRSECFFSNDNFINKLKKSYNSLYKEFTKYALHNSDEEFQSQYVYACQKMFDINIEKVLNSILSKLKTLVESKPFSNKLLTKVLVFRQERASECIIININDYCVNTPFSHVVKSTDYKQMMVNMKMIEMISKHVVHSFPPGVELSLRNKYENFFFFERKKI